MRYNEPRGVTNAAATAQEHLPSSVFGVSFRLIFRSRNGGRQMFINVVYDSSNPHFEQECFMVTAYINHIHNFK
jgi:hypothetical protein